MFMHQYIFYLQRPEKKRKYYLILLGLLILYNVAGGLFPDEDIAISVVTQNILAYGAVINLKQFEFYFETTLYYLISTREIIYQIVNLALVEGNLLENEVSLGKILAKVQTEPLKDLLRRSSIGLKEVNELRNSLAHRFSKTGNDFRSSISEDGKKYNSFKRMAIDYVRRVEILNTGIKNLHQFYKEMGSEIYKKFPLDS